MSSGRRPPSERPPLQVEIVHDADALRGPGMAIVDLLTTMATIARLRRDPTRIGWQWTGADGRATPRPPVGAERRRVAWPDAIVVPGWSTRSGPHLDALVRRHAGAGERLHAVHARGGAVLGVYTGVALLGAAGLLEDRDASVPWPFAQSVRRQAPGMRLTADAWIGDSAVWTCDSPARATDAMLELLRATSHRALAESAAAVLVPTADRRRLSGAIEASSRPPIGPGAIERARRWLDEHVDRPYDLEALARAAATSPRSLLRHFRAAHGATPLQYLHGVRATRARMLLETTYLTVEAIAEACGYRDGAMFRRIFVQATGLTPSAYRERFRLRTRRRDWGREPSG